MPPKPEHKLIGARFKEFRTSKKLTHAQVAEDTGQTVLTVSRIENGHRLPNIEMLILMASKYGMNIDQILLGASVPAGKAKKTNNGTDTEMLARVSLLEARVEKIDRVVSALSK